MLVLRGNNQKSIIFGLISSRIHSFVLSEEELDLGITVPVYIRSVGFIDCEEKITGIIKAHSPHNEYGWILYYSNKNENDLNDVKEFLNRLEVNGVTFNTILACK